MSSMTSISAAPFSRDDLHPYQERAVEFIKANKFCALWCDMGLGKTVSTLTAVQELIDEFRVHKVLVIAPVRVALNTWPNEINHWSHLPGLSIRNITGTPAAREAIVSQDPSDVHVISRDLVAWLVKVTISAGRDWPYDMVVIDEASSFKSSKTQRFKMLRKARPHIDRSVELTGTPASNGLLDVWSQIYLLDQGTRLGRTFSKFRDTYFVSDYHGYNWTLRPGSDTAIYSALQDICLTMSAADYLTLPDRVDRTIRVAMPSQAKARYRELEREFLIELEDETVTVSHAAALANKLLQFANGAVYLEDGQSSISVHDIKLDALAEIVDETQGSPLLVAFAYRSDADRLAVRFPQAQRLSKDPEQIRAWNRGEIPILLAHPASAGHGLNLQRGGCTIVWFGLTWSLELYQQFNARLHRQGQDRPVIVHHLVTEDTIDFTVLDALARKDTTQRALLAALKSDISGRV